MIFVALLLFGMLAFWLSVYGYFLFSLGRRWGAQYRLKVSSQFAAFAIGLAASLVALPFWFVVPHPIYRLCSVLAVWLIHFQPVSVGFWAEAVNAREADAKRFTATTDEWLAEWEPDPELPEKVEP